MGRDSVRKYQPPAAEEKSSAPPGVGPSPVVGVVAQPAGYLIEYPNVGDVNPCVNAPTEGSGLATGGRVGEAEGAGDADGECLADGTGAPGRPISPG
jgi:hypothetical protein